MQEITFEAAFTDLNEVVQQLEQGNLTLEEMITLYERGQALASHCQKQLDQAELRVIQLTEDNQKTQ
jgi:exodeoxyribonuclease VII small subunit